MKNELADSFSRRIEETLSFSEWKKWFLLLVLLIGVLALAFALEKAFPGPFHSLAERVLYAVLFSLAAYAL